MTLQVQRCLMKIYHSLLGIKNVPLLEEVYRYILGDLYGAFKVLVPDVGELVDDNPWQDVVYSPVEAELIVVFNLCALSEIGNVKNSIIGVSSHFRCWPALPDRSPEVMDVFFLSFQMWALKPSIFELLTTNLNPLCKQLTENHPSVQFALTFTLYSHCSR